MLILGLESSCDETAAAVVRDGRSVLSNVIASQYDLHAEYGGVVPEIASRAHVERVLPVVRKAVAEAGVALKDIEGIAVGHRPGLIGSLLVGVAAAKGLAWSLGVPLVGVDHVQAHLYSGLLHEGAGDAAGLRRGADELFPALGLVVSGGHTAMFRCDDALRVTRLGSTIDDAVGEAYDKVAMLLGLGHPGGPRVDALAQRGDEARHEFPKSRLSPESLDFSFSGLKTAVLYCVRGFPGRDGRWPERGSPLTEREQADIAASFQRAAVGVIVLKVERALLRLRQEGVRAKSLLVGGGVSANSRLRVDLARFADDFQLKLVVPPMEYCMDNAAMIAGLGWERLSVGDRDDLTLAAEPTTGV
ncbi:MAG: tRNA (adenosine(37)-N6)-threonylcarbamoyltransferase complex transferase subunit TsaD [Phycisphaerae bacterium]|nr:tRNA (adenosine(37)-N6)-threonylcarbamoyltransferase complex transferase subunit TsaD [Phycisphaerae bacterium]